MTKAKMQYWRVPMNGWMLLNNDDTKNRGKKMSKKKKWNVKRKKQVANVMMCWRIFLFFTFYFRFLIKSQIKQICSLQLTRDNVRFIWKIIISNAPKEPKHIKANAINDVRIVRRCHFHFIPKFKRCTVRLFFFLFILLICFHGFEKSHNEF